MSARRDSAAAPVSAILGGDALSFFPNSTRATFGDYHFKKAEESPSMSGQASAPDEIEVTPAMISKAVGFLMHSSLVDWKTPEWEVRLTVEELLPAVLGSGAGEGTKEGCVSVGQD